MTRIFLFLTTVVLITLGSGCKKCYRCTVLDSDSSAIYEYPDICGSKSDAEAYEQRCVTEYGSFDFTCSCAAI